MFAGDGQVGGKCKKWWKSRSDGEKRLIIVATVGVVLLIVFLLIYLPLSATPSDCTTPTCSLTATQLQTFLDETIDPCEDFYSFACGGFLKSEAPPLAPPTWSVLDSINEEIQSQIQEILEAESKEQDELALVAARTFYKACMNESAIEKEGLGEMKVVLHQMGGWPTLLANRWKEEEFDWKKAVFRLRQTGVLFSNFIKLEVKKDFTKYVLSVESPYKRAHISNEVKKLHLDYMVDIAVLMGAERHRARREQNQVLDLLLKLVKITEEAKTLNGTDLRNLLSLSELQYEFPGIPWMEYINHILGPGVRITHDDEICVTDPSYLKKLLVVLKHTDKRILANFMSWQILEDFVIYLPGKVQKRVKEYIGEAGQISRSKFCTFETKNRFSSVISAVFIENYLDDETRQSALSMIREIKQQFRESLYKLDWLDFKSKEVASERLMSSIEEIPQLDDFIERNKLYEKVEIFEDKLLASILNLDYTNTNILYGKLRLPVIQRFFKETPAAATNSEIVYSPEENTLRISMGRLRSIFYHKNRPQCVNFGALGVLIAHEMYHIITEAKYGGRLHGGEARSWWSPHSLLNYEVRLQCLSNRYGKFITANDTVSGVQRNEEMADVAGLKVAYEALKIREGGLPGLKYTSKQLFWIVSAARQCTRYEGKSPVAMRVNAALQNLDEFSTDFSCGKGSGMNPFEKCRVW